MKRRVAWLVLICFTCMGCAQEVRQLDLPAELLYPEGIAINGEQSFIYTAGGADGRVVRVDIQTGRAETIAEPGAIVPVGTSDFPAALGLELDTAGQLWVSGGRTGVISVLDTKTGTVLRKFPTGRARSLLNDIVVTVDAAYVTDTLEPVLWRVPLTDGEIGELEAWIDFTNSPLRYVEGANLNGIEVTPDGKTLLVVQMNTGRLFRIDTRSASIAPIDIGEETVAGGDGLVLDGQTLYVVRQPDAEIVTIKLADDFLSGQVTARFKDPGLLWPATAVKAHGNLLVANSQFNKRGSSDPSLPFSIAVVPLELLD
jgi:sugar lactone lactonase YvrE